MQLFLLPMMKLRQEWDLKTGEVQIWEGFG